MAHRRPPKLSDEEYRGCVRIFLTLCTFDRVRHFARPDVVDLVHRQLSSTSTERSIENIAYCYMPDHLHLLVAGSTASADARGFIKVFRQRAGYATRQMLQVKLWQEGYFDKHLRDEESTFDVVSYIVANPVRAGLCRHPREYPFLGSGTFRLEDLCLSVQWRPH